MVKSGWGREREGAEVRAGVRAVFKGWPPPGQRCFSEDIAQTPVCRAPHTPPPQAAPSHPAAQRGAPHPGPSFLPFSVQALCGPVYNYVGVSDCYMVQKAAVVATCSDATFGIGTSELKVVPATAGDYRRGFCFVLFSFTSNTNKPK